MFGRWAPYVDAGQVQDHIQTLRGQGISYQQIARQAGFSVSHIRELAGTMRRSGKRPQIQRVRPDTASRILAIDPATVMRSAGSPIDATGTRRRLQALAAIGWSTPTLATELGRTPSSVKRTMTADRVLASTADLVRNLYEQLCLSLPPETTPEQAAAATTARVSAQADGWLPPLAWDDIDRDEKVPHAPTCPRDIDQIAVDRAVSGDGIRLRDLTNAEQTEAIRMLTERGKSIRDIAEQLATTTRTVSRRRGAIRAA